MCTEFTDAQSCTWTHVLYMHIVHAHTNMLAQGPTHRYTHTHIIILKHIYKHAHIHWSQCAMWLLDFAEVAGCFLCIQHILRARMREWAGIKHVQYVIQWRIRIIVEQLPRCGRQVVILTAGRAEMQPHSIPYLVQQRAAACWLVFMVSFRNVHCFVWWCRVYRW